MKVGDIVVSLCGHDIGEWYVVYEVSDELVYLIDGKNKPLQKPKKKKIKHVAKTSFYAESVATKIANGEYLLDAEVQKTLKFFKNNY